jgi:hypothetical protein
MEKIPNEKEMFDTYDSILLAIQQQFNKMRKKNIVARDIGQIIIEGMTAATVYAIDKLVIKDLIARQIIIDGINQRLIDCILRIGERGNHEKSN